MRIEDGSRRLVVMAPGWGLAAAGEGRGVMDECVQALAASPRPARLHSSSLLFLIISILLGWPGLASAASPASSDQHDTIRIGNILPFRHHDISLLASSKYI